MTPDNNGNHLADELRQASERVRELADKLKAREQALAEMESTHRYLVKYAYAKLREEMKLEVDDGPPEDVEAMIREGKAFPFEAFIGDIDNILQGR